MCRQAESDFVWFGLVSELMSPVNLEHETVTDYIFFQAETAATALKNTGETLTDSLLIAIVTETSARRMKAVCCHYYSKRKDQTLSEFKVALPSFEDFDQVDMLTGNHSVM